MGSQVTQQQQHFPRAGEWCGIWTLLITPNVQRSFKQQQGPARLPVKSHWVPLHGYKGPGSQRDLHKGSCCFPRSKLFQCSNRPVFSLPAKSRSLENIQNSTPKPEPKLRDIFRLPTPRSYAYPITLLMALINSRPWHWPKLTHQFQKIAHGCTRIYRMHDITQLKVSEKNPWRHSRLS